MSARVAVAVVSWNTRELLASCLRSLQADAEAGVAEVWVVDNASDDGSADLVRDSFPWVRLVASDENLGYGKAVNVVASQTDTAWVGMANADIRVRKGALRGLLDAAARDAQAAALAPRLILPDGSTERSVLPFPSPRVALATALGLGRTWDETQERRVPWAVGAFLLVRRDAWDAVGGFDEHHWMYTEDLDLGWRLGQAGFPMLYVPDAEVEHDYGAATAKAWPDERTLRKQRLSYAWLLRRRGWLVTRTVAVIELTGAAVRYAVLPRSRPRWRQWIRLHRTGLERASRLRAQR